MQYHYFNDPLFEKMHNKLALFMLEQPGMNSVEAGVYSYDLVERWYVVLDDAPKEEYGVPVTIDLLPLGEFPHQLVDDLFPELSILKRAAIAAAWFDLRGELFFQFVEMFSNEDHELHDSDLVLSFGKHMHLVPDDDLFHENVGVSLRMFSTFDDALNYGRN